MQTFGHPQTGVWLWQDRIILICVKQVTLRWRRKQVYLPVVARAIPTGWQSRVDLCNGVPMRDLVADWKKWTRAERVLGVMGTLLMVALPLGLLMTG
jgi:hypothetical protein